MRKDIPLVCAPSEARNHLFNTLFNPEGVLSDGADLSERCESFCELTDHFLSTRKDSPYSFDDVVFDPHGLRLMLGRFQRDAFGVQRLWKKLDDFGVKNRLAPEDIAALKEDVMDVGLRVGSADPKKTRIAAVFSLWMCAFRPVSLKYSISNNDPAAGKFCAGLNYWIATSYLSKFGSILVGPELAEHLRRIAHDFTYRDVNLSSIELFYCGIFRPNKVISA